jgi:glycosyltransferase involved in cell wall biosynthesis
MLAPAPSTPPAPVRVAVLFDRLGPYHWARLNAAGRLLRVAALEFFAESADYAWDKVVQSGAFERVTLFPETDRGVGTVSEFKRRLAEAFAKVRPLAVAVPGWSECGALAALGWCQRHAVPAVVMSESTAGDEPRRWWREAVKRRLISWFSAGLVGGRLHADYLARLGMPADRIFQGYDAVDNEYFRTRADQARQRAAEVRQRLGLPERFFLASARFIEKKNLPNLMAAYAEYRESAGVAAWKLVLLGDGPLRAEIEARIAALALKDDVCLPGFKQYGELPEYYALAGAFVHASSSEQWGLVVNEAMAAGLPILVSERCGCAADLVEPGRNGFTFDPGNVGQIADLMQRVAGPGADPEAMGRASREIIARWSVGNFAVNLERAVNAALSSPAPVAGPAGALLLRVLMRR